MENPEEIEQKTLSPSTIIIFSYGPLWTINLQDVKIRDGSRTSHKGTPTLYFT